MDSVPATPSSQIFKGIEPVETPIVDGSVLEAAKENIQPLARGRRATALSQALSTPHRERAARLTQEREEMRANLAQAIEDDEDPLAGYLAFVDWTIESYPQGHNSDSGLITLFDEATRTLKDDPRYKNDLRYLKLWILYSTHVEKPVDMFAFLLANDIGTIYTLFYEEYALALERDGRRSEADEMYRLGINRRVRPLERLQTRYKEFQLRMMAGPLHAEPAPASTAPQAKRKALGEVSSRKGAAAPLRDANPATGSNSRIQPFVDGEDGAVQEPGNEWPEFGTRTSRIKENAREVERPGDVKMKLAKGPARPAPIEVFRDEVAEPQTPSAQTRTNAMTPAKGTSEAELLRRDPFRNYSKEAQRPATTSTSTSTTIPSAPAPAPVPSSKASGIITDPYPNLLSAPAPGKRPEKHRFKLDLLWSNNVESCIQEARARHLGLLGKKWPAPPMPEGSSAVSVDFNENGKKTSKGFLSAAGAIPSEPTVTINTKAALADVYGMFNSPTKSMRPSDFPREEIVVAPKADENAGAKRLPMSRAPSNENAIRAPPKLKGDEISRKRPSPPTDAQFATPMQPKKAKNDNHASKALSEKKHAFTPFRDDEAATPKAFAIFKDEPQEPAPSNEFSVFRDEPEEAPQHAFQPFVDEDESGAIPPPRTTPSFRPFVDDEDVAATPTPAFRPYVDEDEDIVPSAPAFRPFVDGDEDAHMEDDNAAVSFRDRLNALRPSTESTYESSNTGDFDRGFVEPASVAISSGDESNSVLPPSLLCEDAPIPDDSFERVERPFRISDGHTIDYRMDTSALPSFAMDTMTMSTMEFTTSVLPSGPQLQNLPNPCNAYSKQISHALLELMDQDPRCHRFDSQTSNKWTALQKFSASKGRKSNDTTIDLSKLSLSLGKDTFEVTGKLGEGAFGAVYVARDCDMGELLDEDGEDNNHVAIKIVRPSARWEFSMLARLLAALPRELHSSFIHPRSLYTFADESFFVMNLSKQGTLLDVVNRAATAKVAQVGGGLEEPLVQFFAIELMKLLTTMHAAGFIHGDLKIDNCMLRLDSTDEWSLVYDPTGAHGWGRKGVRLIDFGRMIDTRMFPAGQTFTCDWDADDKDCMEVREGRPWTYQTDYFGLAAIVYTMLYGKHMEGVNVVNDGGVKRYTIKQQLKRYWQMDLWSRFFDMLLNPGLVRPDGALPICDELTVLRADMEDSLRKSKKSLKSLLKKVEVATLTI